MGKRSCLSENKAIEAMNKKMYVKPAQRVIDVRTARIICQSVNHVSAPFGYGGGGSGPARSRSRDAWDDEE